MTDDELNRLKELCDKAKDSIDKQKGIILPTDEYRILGDEAYESMPLLIAEVRRLREALENMPEGDLTRLHTDGHQWWWSPAEPTHADTKKGFDTPWDALEYAQEALKHD